MNHKPSLKVLLCVSYLEAIKCFLSTHFSVCFSHKINVYLVIRNIIYFYFILIFSLFMLHFFSLSPVCSLHFCFSIVVLPLFSSVFFQLALDKIRFYLHFLRLSNFGNCHILLRLFHSWLTQCCWVWISCKWNTCFMPKLQLKLARTYTV